MKAADGMAIGKISKQWSGLVKEAFTDADNFGVTFPLELDVNLKAMILAATFLIVRTFPSSYSNSPSLLFCGRWT